MLNITTHDGNANENHNDMSLWWWNCDEKETPVQCWWECKLYSHYGKYNGRPSKKLKIEPFMIQQFHLILYLKGKKKTLIQKDMWTHMLWYVICIARRESNISIYQLDEWIKKCFIYKMEYYSVLKKEITSFVTTWMDLEGIILSDMSGKEKYCMSLFICGI